MSKARTKRCLIVGVVLFSFLMTAVERRSGAQTPADFDRAYQEFRINYLNELKRHGIAGSSFFFVHNNQVIAKEFHGLAHVEQNRAVDEDTIYHWASITKSFTGIAIMQLRDRGLLKLDDPVIKYLPELKAVHNPFGDVGDITIKHLMSKKQLIYDDVLKRSSLEEMWRPQLSASRDFTQGRMNDDTAVGLAFFIDNIEGQRYVGHNGDQNGFKSFLSVSTGTRTASILVFNTETQPTTNNPRNLLSAESKIARNVLKLFQSLTTR